MTSTTRERFKALFSGRENCYGWYLDLGDKTKNRVKTVHTAPSDEAWDEHLSGSGAGIGIAPIKQDNSCVFGAIDLDDPATDHANLEQKIAELALPLITCRSKSGGAHLYLFLTDPVPAEAVRQKLYTFIDLLGVINPQGRAVEVFPKQDKTKPQDEASWINLPYFNSDDTQRYAFLGGKPLTLEEFLRVAEGARVTREQLAAVRALGENPFTDGPPCLEHLHAQGVGEGGRNNYLYNVATCFRLMEPEGWEMLLEDYNANMDDPLTDREVKSIIKSVSRVERMYKCLDIPIVDHCQKALCKKRRWGIDRLGSHKRMEEFPPLGPLQKVASKPPIWRLTVDGSVIEMSTLDLSNFGRMQLLAMEATNKILPVLKSSEWHEKLAELLQSVEIVSAPDDAGPEGAMLAMTRLYLTMRKRSQTREDILRGLPWEERDRVLFQSHNLSVFITQQSGLRTTLHELYEVLSRRMGAKHEKIELHGAQVEVWSLPSPKGEQIKDFTVPEPEGAPMS